MEQLGAHVGNWSRRFARRAFSPQTAGAAGSSSVNPVAGAGYARPPSSRATTACRGMHFGACAGPLILTVKNGVRCFPDRTGVTYHDWSAPYWRWSISRNYFSLKIGWSQCS